MPKTTSKLEPWVAPLRSQVRDQNGEGWKVQEQSDKVRIFHKLEDGTRPSITTDLPWKKSSAKDVLNLVVDLKSKMDEQNLGLKEAYALVKKLGEVSTPGQAKGAIDWQTIADEYMSTKAGYRSTTLKDTGTRVNKAVALFSKKPQPTNGSELMKLYAQTYFAQCPAGGIGRKRHLGDVAAFLGYAIESCGVDKRWTPVKGDALQQLIGFSDGMDDKLTPPIKPEQLAALLDALEADGNHELRLAVALVGCFGLRPSELAALDVEEGRLYIFNNVKRNKSSMGKSVKKRRVIALEVEGRNDGARALKLFTSGLTKLPQALRNRIAKVTNGGSFKPVGDEFRQQLERYPFWQSLAAATPGLTPYSLRHGWAWRAHKSYERTLSVRDAAALMGHTPATHHKHYGRWTDEQGLEDAVARLTSGQTSISNPELTKQG